MKRALIFDATGLLYYREPGHYEPLRELLRRQGLKVRNPWIVYDVVNRYSKVGIIHQKEMIEIFLKVLGIYTPKFAREYFKTYKKLKSQVKLCPHVKEGLKKLYDMGFKLFVFSDSSTTSLEKLKWLKKLKIAKYFDKVICSCDVGYLKSDIKKFRKFLRMINVRKNNAVFVYHELQDVVSAKLLGVTCVSVKKGILEDYYIKDLSELPELMKKLNKC